MTFKKQFTEDKAYQEFIHDFNRKKARFDEMARQGIYKKSALQEVARKLHNDLRTNIEEYSATTRNALESRLKTLEGASRKAGYSERADEAKEFEMRYKLASDYELESIVLDLDTTDLLEINLLRMELKNRKLEAHDEKVQNYINQNELDGMTESERVEYADLQERLGVIVTLGSNYLVGQENLIPLSSIESELNRTATTVVNDKGVLRDVNVNQF